MARKAKSIHVLVIRLSAMGDVAMTVPLLLLFKSHYPDIKLTILTKPQYKPIFDSLSGTTVFTAAVNDRHKGIWGLWKLYKELRACSISHVADFHNVLRSTILRTFFRLSGIPVTKLDKARRAKKKLTKPTNKVFAPLPSTFERYSQALAELGFPINLDNTIVLGKQKLLGSSARFLDKNSSKYIGIAPFAAYSSKTYGLKEMQTVIQELLNESNYQILLFGGGAREVVQLQEIKSKFKRGVLCVAGELSLKEELALISNLDIMLAMDSSNGHLAANYGVPVVTVWGVTHPYTGFAPYNQPLENSILPDRDKYPAIPTSIYGNKFPVGYENAINSIAPKIIADRIIEVLKKN